MTELKTLKDIDENYQSVYKSVGVKELKAEAVKWIKEIRNVWEEGLAVEKSDKILMRIFNLTEEELKNGDKK